MVRRRTGLFLVVVVVVVTVLTAAPGTATPAAALFRLLRRLDGVRQLLQGQADAPLVRVHPDDQERQLVADADQLVGPADRPAGHLRDVEQAVHARLELDERAVVGEAHDLAPRLGAGRVRLLDALPGIRRLLLVAERHPAGLAVEVEDHDLDLVADLEDLRGVAHSTPAHVGHVEKAINAAEVDERPVVGDVLDGARERHAFGEDLQCVLLLLLALLLEHRAAREHDVAAAAVELDDLGPDRLADHRGQVLHRAEVHLGARQERLDPDVDGEAALDDLDHPALHRRALLVGLGDRVPDLDLVGLVLGKDNEPLGVLFGLEVHLDLFAHLRQGAVPVELLDRDRPFALVADVDEDFARADVDHTAADDFALLELGHAVLVPVLHAFLGRFTALPARSAEVLPWFILLHTARSSSHFICSELRTTRTSASRCRQ